MDLDRKALEEEIKKLMDQVDAPGEAGKVYFCVIILFQIIEV